MDISVGFSLFGYHISKVDIAIKGISQPITPASVVDYTIKGISKHWVGRLFK